MIEAVIFDLFETLITEWGHEKYTKRKMSEDLNLDYDLFTEYWDEHEYGRYHGSVSFEDSIQYTCERSGIALLPETLAHMISKRMETKAACFNCIDSDIIALLESLKSKGIHLAMLSNCSSEEVIAIRQSHLASFFDAIVLSYEAGLSKPDPLIYQKIFEKLQLTAAQCLFVGDGGSNELFGARAVGMQAVQAKWYTNNHPIPRESIDGFQTAERPLDVMSFIMA